MENEATFMSITGVEDPQAASQFLEMAGGNLEAAVGLFFEHGISLVQQQQPQSSEPISEPLPPPEPIETDEQMAERLQKEMYQSSGQQHGGAAEDDDVDEFGVRRPIQPVRETLVDVGGGYYGGGFHQPLMTPQQSMFGQTQRGIFNQMGENDIIDLDSEESDDEQRHRMTSTQRRLANIFKPPFDIITRSTLDQAKIQAKDERKWILINIQDVTDFRCQVLNRDFWSSRQVKNLVQDHFIFLQFHHDSHGGISYRNLYPFEDFPHIAILDPITGEQMMKWSEKPEIHQWIDQVTDFLLNFKLHTGATNVAPLTQGMSEHNAIDLDQDDSYDEDEYHDIDEDGSDNEEDDDEVIVLSDDDEPSSTEIAPTPPVEEVAVPVKQLTYSEQIRQLPAEDIADPTENATRIQIRSLTDGKRVVKSLSLETPVMDLFKFVKFSFKDTLNGQAFRLKMQRDDVWDKRDMSVKEAGVSGAALMLEVVDDEDDDDSE